MAPMTSPGDPQDSPKHKINEQNLLEIKKHFKKKCSYHKTVSLKLSKLL